MQEVKPLAAIIKVDNFKAGKVYAHATREQFSKFIVKNYVYTVVPGKRAALPPARVKAKPAPPGHAKVKPIPPGQVKKISAKKK